MSGSDRKLYWNREESTDQGMYYDRLTKPSSTTTASSEPTVVAMKSARIICLSDPNDPANQALYEELPKGATFVGVGTTLQDFESTKQKHPNVLLVTSSCPNAKQQLVSLLTAFPSIEWVHCRSAGIDFVFSDELSKFDDKLVFTNAKGQFSSTLAEYTMMAISYFAKDLPRLLKNKQSKNWDRYEVEEIRGKTLGIIGYGDIGRACAKLAHAYGMKIVALRRNPDMSRDDPYCDAIYGSDPSNINKLMKESDYILCAAPGTPATRGLVGAEAFQNANESAVFINLGRGSVVDEQALISSLKSNKLKGAALDVFMQEPLPHDSELWKLENVLLSPHNMDKTARFLFEATEFFVRENLPRFICGQDLLNPVSVKNGY